MYNSYPFPRNVDLAKQAKVEKAAKAVLEAREKYKGNSLADLYDTNTMPIELVKAHEALDKAVDQCYRSQPFLSDLNRIEFLLGLYELYSAPLFPKSKKKK